MGEFRKKIVIFGAGGGGRAFYALNAEACDVVAFVDSNPDLHGSSHEGTQILPPQEIATLKFDEIVIASMWVREIREQIRSLGVAENRIVIPPKHQLKNGLPFETIATRKFAERSIFSLTDALRDLGIRVYVDFGTLLGIAREGHLLPWDDDVDMSVTDASFQKLEASWIDVCAGLPTPDRAHWQSSRVHDGVGHVQGLTLDLVPANGCEVDAFGLMVRQRRTEGEFSIPTGAVGALDIPKYHFEGADELELRPFGMVSGPREHTRYLERVYGDWRTPRRDLKFSDYADVDPRSFGEISPNSLDAERIF